MNSKIIARIFFCLEWEDEETCCHIVNFYEKQGTRQHVWQLFGDIVAQYYRENIPLRVSFYFESNRTKERTQMMTLYAAKFSQQDYELIDQTTQTISANLGFTYNANQTKKIRQQVIHEYLTKQPIIQKNLPQFHSLQVVRNQHLAQAS